MKQLLTILLSLLILLSSSGLTLATHFCGSHAVKSELSFGDSDLSCGMKMTSSCEKNSSNKPLLKRNCCHNEYMSIDVDDEFQNHYVNINLNTHFLVSFFQVFIIQAAKVVEKQEVIVYASPPPKKQNVQILFQSFLI